MTASGAIESIVQLKLAGVASVLPAASRARTWNVWTPWARPVRLFGLVQAAYAAPSTEHSNVAEPSGEVNAKLALVEVLFAFGLDVMLVSGDVVSIVQVKLA